MEKVVRTFQNSLGKSEIFDDQSVNRGSELSEGENNTTLKLETV